MIRPLTDRSTDAAKLDVPVPQGFPNAFQRLVDERNRTAENARERIYASSLFEGAIGGLIQVGDEHVTFITAPCQGFIHKKFLADEALKEDVEQPALTYGISRSAVVMTVFHHLDRHGALRDTGASASTLGS